MSTDSTAGAPGGEASAPAVDPSPPPSTIVTDDDLDTATLLLIVTPDGGAHIYSAAGLPVPDLAAMLRAVAHSLDDNDT